MSSPAVPPPLNPDIFDELIRLRATEREYNITIKVVACLAEIAAKASGGPVEITDSQLAESPSLLAWRDEDRGTVVIETSR